ncbi:hypothetical protein FHR83_009333 [Actinoplanes campanulatus]|uniref:Uncharacterized protein n=1 Tax=Actinoplanes campanulatus TaxID=113559 RepID=A0A7W5FKB5_9ACTN|nr:hypothetical protein [Actinoplanes campanulatus]MBB3101604.1 hypothetical protein [Actinoplanes campanulatus]
MSFSSRRLGGTVVAILCVAAAMGTSGCSGGNDAPKAKPSSSPVPSFDLAAIEAEADDLWVSDGTIGFFLERADSAAIPFSLEETYWNVRLREFDPDRGERLQAQLVEPWLTQEITGSHTEGLPRAVQVDYAVQVATALGVAVDRSVVVSALEPLRADGLYKSSSDDAQGDWGSTVHAVSALHRVGAPVDASVLERVRSALGTPSAGSTAGQAATNFAPQMLLAALLKDQLPTVPTDLQAAYDTAVSLVDGAGADPVSVATSSFLNAAAKELNLRVHTTRPKMCGILDADRLVRLPGADAPDVQLTVYAATLGCDVRIPAETPYSGAGWPKLNGQALTEAMQNFITPTAAVLRLKHQNGSELSAPVRAALVQALRAVWAPAIGTEPVVTLAQTARLARLAEIAEYLGQPLPSAVSSDDSPESGPAVLMRMFALAQQKQPGAADVKAARRLVDQAIRFERQAPMEVAASMEMASRLLRDKELHADAIRIIAAERQAIGVYSLQPGAGAGASLEASILGAWISGDGSVPMQAWIRVGLCTADFICRESRNDEFGDTSLTFHGASLVAACRQPHCGEDVPPFF